MILHFIIGIFMSASVRSTVFIAKLPDEICAAVPLALFRYCSEATDQLPLAGVFISLGAFFSGIAAGITTFGGRERRVFWRETSCGLSTTSYFIGKFAFDLFRIAVSSFLYTCGLAVIFAYTQRFAELYLLMFLAYLTGINKINPQHFLWDIP
jgi:hypothetical protein